MSDKIRDAVQHLVVDALTAADLVRSGHRSKALSDRLSQHCSVLSKMIAAVPAAPVAQEPVAWRVSDPNEPEIGFWLSEEPGTSWHRSEPLYTAPPAAEQPAPAAPVAPWPATWVSVADRLPGEDSEVIVSGWVYNDPARGRFVTHADFSDGQFKPVGAADEYDALHPPTHWMPMPAAPGEAPAPAAEQPDAWTPSGADYDRNIHRNPDAAAWADLFVATFPGLADKHDLMLGWFANAMMAMHDFLKAEQPDTVKVPRELLAEAESIIESYAESLKASHAPGGDWEGEEAAHDEYELEAGVASKLRALLAGGAE